MPLDNAQFISELSILDPPGTDPLNQGDDQIRTTKRATQQSFPNIDAPVPQTAAQMAQMAIKNEVNLFTQSNTFSNQLGIILDSSGTVQQSFDQAGVRQWQISYSGTSKNLDIRRFLGGTLIDAPIEFLQATGRVAFQQGIDNADGSATTPSYNFANRDAGMYASAGNRLNWATAGVNRAFLDVSQFRSEVQMTLIDGTSANKAYSFATDLGMGMWKAGGATLAFGVGGSDAMFIASQQMRAVIGGSAAFPSWSFQDFTNSGMFATVAGTLQFASGGVQRMFLDGSGVTSNSGFRATGGSATNPSFAFAAEPTTGIFRDVASRMSFGTLGALRMIMQTGLVQVTAGNTFQALGPIHATNGSAGAPAYSFTNQTNHGMWNGASTQLNFSSSGVHMLTLSPLQIQANLLGTEANPVYSFTGVDNDIGFFGTSGNGITAVTGNQTLWAMSLNGNFSGLTLQNHVDGNLGTTVPGWTFNNDPDTGFGRNQANVASIIAAGVEIATYGTAGFGIRAGTPTFLNLPTSPGFGGSLWNDGGTVKVA